MDVVVVVVVVVAVVVVAAVVGGGVVGGGKKKGGVHIFILKNPRVYIYIYICHTWKKRLSKMQPFVFLSKNLTLPKISNAS